MGFGGGGSPPPVVVPPPVPIPNTLEDDRAQERIRQAQEAQRKAQGARADIKTSPTGLPDEPSTTRNTLLGRTGQ